MNLRIGLHFPRSELLSVLEIRLDFELATFNQIMTVDHAERKGQKLTLIYPILLLGSDLKKMMFTSLDGSTSSVVLYYYAACKIFSRPETGDL